MLEAVALIADGGHPLVTFETRSYWVSIAANTSSVEAACSSETADMFSSCSIIESNSDEICVIIVSSLSILSAIASIDFRDYQSILNIAYYLVAGLDGILAICDLFRVRLVALFISQ